MKSYKKYFTGSMRGTALVFLIACTILPSTMSAQTTGVTTQVTDDGSTETREQRRERIQNYRQQSSEMQLKIQALGTTIVSSVPVPVLFGVALSNISPNFGDPRSGGRLHEGEDIMAVKGTPIVSPTPAVVIRTGTGTTEGLYVYTANPGGETFVYMHLDKIGEGVATGVVLPQGGLIGYVGNTGNASGGAAHLHFEIHNSADVPVNPYPRLSTEFSLQQKISYLTTILSQTSDSTALANLLVTNFRSTFTAAINQNIALPGQITSALASIPAGSVPSSTTTLPAGDLDLGSSGSAVVALQTYLIQAASGSAATRLAGAGATGNFGPMTQAALIEFQIKVGLSPANGYYGLTTRTYVTAHPVGTSPITPPVTTATLTRNLSVGMTGEDVRTLQKILNARGYQVALSGAGSFGYESTYFGPATKAAVIRFQVARSITPAVGYVGPITRTALGSL